MSSYSIGQMNQLGNALEAKGFSRDEVRMLGQSTLLGDFRGVLIGTHEIRPIDHTIDLSIPCRLPFDDAECVSPAKSGIVRLERRGDDLYLDGKKIRLVLSERQKNGKVIKGHELRVEREKLGGNLSAKILDYLVEHPELWPESWKKDPKGRTIYIFFWDDIFRDLTIGSLCIRCGVWRDDGVVSGCGWLDDGWGGQGPAASLAS